MSLNTEVLFTAALGLQSPWRVERAELSVANKRIDFDVICTERRLACPHCGAPDQSIHERIQRSWRHLDFFQYEAWVHASVPRVACTACGKTSQVPVPWARAGSGFTLLFEALALSLCKELPVAHAARHLRADAKALWRRIEHYVNEARAQDDMSEVRHIGIDETSVRKGHEYITVAHDMEQKRLLFATEGRDHKTVEAFTKDLLEHGGQPQAIEHVSMDMSAAYLKGVQQQLPQAAICYDRFPFMWPRWRARRWTRCAVQSSRPGPTRWPARCAIWTDPAGAACTGRCARTTRAGTSDTCRRCTACSARTCKAHGPGA